LLPHDGSNWITGQSPAAASAAMKRGICSFINLIRILIIGNMDPGFGNRCATIRTDKRRK